MSESAAGHCVEPSFSIHRNSNAEVTMIEVATPGCTVRYQMIGSTAVQSGPVTGNLHDIDLFHDAVARLPFVQAVASADNQDSVSSLEQ